VQRQNHPAASFFMYHEIRLYEIVQSRQAVPAKVTQAFMDLLDRPSVSTERYQELD
jgi:hypothetical protein